jgi:hypothetical protein
MHSLYTGAYIRKCLLLFVCYLQQFVIAKYNWHLGQYALSLSYQQLEYTMQVSIFPVALVRAALKIKVIDKQKGPVVAVRFSAKYQQPMLCFCDTPTA